MTPTKTKYKYIEFVPNADDKNITNCINIKSGSVLAHVFYYKPWRQFIFTQTGAGVVFSQDCLEDITNYLNQLNRTDTKIDVKTETILKDIFSHIEGTMNKEYEESEFYKELFERKLKDPTGWLLMRWNKDMFIALHYLNKIKSREKKYQVLDIISLLEKAVAMVKNDYEDFITRHTQQLNKG